MKTVEITLRDQLAALVQSMGYEFVGCELRHQRRSSLLRIYIDSVTGITVNDCSLVSRQISAVLDVEDPIAGEYVLEVSSPGIDRPLFDIAHYEKQIGSRLKVRTYAPIEGQRNFVGILVRVEGATIHLLVDQKETMLSFADIERANVIADIR